MKEIPLLFSSPMVAATLDKRKKITRRLKGLEYINKDPGNWKHIKVDSPFKPADVYWFEGPGHDRIAMKCPYGKPGDFIWVRESWQLKGWDFEEGMMTVKYATGETHKCIAYDPDEDSSWLMDKVDTLEKRGYIKPDPTNDEMFVFTDKKQPFYPSIHMPKEAARIWLQVTGIRVERLKDISDNDAIAEGIESYNRIADIIAYKNYSELARKDFLNVSSYGFDNGKETHSAPVASFCTLWIEINGRESWISNPWVWVVSFKVLSTTGKPDLQNIKAIQDGK